MHTVDSLMDEAKSRQGIKSDYKLAQVLGVTQNTVANYRHGRSRPDDLMLTKLGELAEVDPEAVELLAVQLQVERAQNEDAKALWARLAARLQAGSVQVAMAFVVAFLALLSHSPTAHATVTALDASKSPGLYIMLNIESGSTRSFKSRLLRLC